MRSGKMPQPKNSPHKLDLAGSDMSQTTVPPQSLTAGISEQLERTPPEVKMRSVSHKLKKVHKKPGLPAHVLQARECYNNMEKQYRTRLKLRFEGLLAVLEACKMRDEAVGEGDPEAPDFGYSRGEVLDAARQRVLTLEEENRHLSTQLSDLNKTLMSQ
ncbi:hypothetical protein QL093DRAFT_2364306 [Fusarium oxysporum]|nr:hypothetical protein QL093DRAFT_2364306 [Fusarium oxysporum]